MRADPISVGGDDGIVHVAQSLVVQVGEPILDSLLKFENAVFIVAEFDFDDGLVQGMKDSVSRLILAEAPVLIAEDLVQRRRLTKFDGVIVENFVGGDCVGFAIYSRRIEDIDGAQLLDDLQRLLVTRMQPAQRHSHGFRGRLQSSRRRFVLRQLQRGNGQLENFVVQN